MRAILLGLIFLCGAMIFLYGGSLPTSYQQLKTGSFKLEFKPMIPLGSMYKGVNKRKLPLPN